MRFQFRLYFHNLTDLELGMLGWTLAIGKNTTSRLKLGMGKPLGMGAVLITSADLHLINRGSRYSTLFTVGKDGDRWECGEKSTEEADQELRSGMSDYEQWLLNHSEVNPHGCKAFQELPRIQELMYLLSWPGPTPPGIYTRYLKIQPNEYRERSVLPTPSGVQSILSKAPLPKKTGEFQPSTSINQERLDKIPEVPDRPSAKAENLFAELQGLGKSPLPKVGDLVTAIVLEDSGSEALLSIEGQPDMVLGRIRTARRQKRYH